MEQLLVPRERRSQLGLLATDVGGLRPHLELGRIRAPPLQTQASKCFVVLIIFTSTGLHRLESVFSRRNFDQMTVR